jgi:hypothetical protein
MDKLSNLAQALPSLTEPELAAIVTMCLQVQSLIWNERTRRLEMATAQRR